MAHTPETSPNTAPAKSKEAASYTITPGPVESRIASPAQLAAINDNLTKLDNASKQSTEAAEKNLQDKTGEHKETKIVPSETKEAPESKPELSTLPLPGDLPTDTWESPALPTAPVITPIEEINVLERSGIMPNNFMKKIVEFFHGLFGDTRISYDQ
jgi:hypothetical protein